MIIKHPYNHVVNLTDRVTLTCHAEGQPTPTIRWKKGSILLDYVGSPLIITEVSLEDRGFYFCVATNTEGSVTSEQALVNIESESRKDTLC